MKNQKKIDRMEKWTLLNGTKNVGHKAYVIFVAEFQIWISIPSSKKWNMISYIIVLIMKEKAVNYMC